MDHQTYDDARMADEESMVGRGEPRYMRSRIAKRINGNVAPDAIKPVESLKIGEGASIAVHYDNKAGFAGKLRGVLWVADGRRTAPYKVWDQELHDQILLIFGGLARVVKVETKPSEKWGDSLTKIEKVG